MPRLTTLLLVLTALLPAQAEGPSKDDIDALKNAVAEAKKAKDTPALAKAFNEAIWLDDARVAAKAARLTLNLEDFGELLALTLRCRWLWEWNPRHALTESWP